MRRGRRKALYSKETGTPWREPIRKQRYSVRPKTREKLGFQRRYIFRKGKSAVEGDPRKDWSGIETKAEVE